MKYLVGIVFCLFSFPALACVDLSGKYEKPIQEIKNYLDLKVFKQSGCSRVAIYDASIYIPTDLYMENPNPVSYKLDGKQHCNAFGFCYAATVNDKMMRVNHTDKEFLKDDGAICISGNISFEINQSRSLIVIRECTDGSTIKARYKIH
jgi:hypothetical protein